jgi:hypothetical protein
MEVSGQNHTPTLRRTSVTVEYEAGWVSGPFWTFWEREIPPHHFFRIRTLVRSALSLVTVPITSSRSAMNVAQ